MRSKRKIMNSPNNNEKNIPMPSTSSTLSEHQHTNEDAECPSENTIDTSEDEVGGELPDSINFWYKHYLSSDVTKGVTDEKEKQAREIQEPYA